MERIEALEDNLAALMSKVTAFSASQYGRRLQGGYTEIGPSGVESLSYTNLVTGTLNSGDTGFMIICTAIVLMMTVPALGLYYSGMVAVKNVLATVMQSFSITCLVTVLYMMCGYSLAFGPTGVVYYDHDTGAAQSVRHSGYFIGDGSRLWYFGLNQWSAHSLAASIPEAVYATYQLTFAIITAALICGSFADRMKFTSMLIFIALWHVAIYCPIAHSNWHQDGFLAQAGVMDFAGGNVVHISSGMAGLMSTIVIGNRKGFGKHRFDPHNILLTFIGASLLWVGWFGFNAGSAVAANGRAGYAALNTQISTSMAAITWMLTQWIIEKKPSVLGMLSGAIAGLVAITPACGWVDMTGAFFIGVLAGPWCYGCAQIKHYAGYDDALDAFGVHATGGLLGGLLTGFFASPQVFGPYVASGAYTTPTTYDKTMASTWYWPGVFYAIGATGQANQLKSQAYGIACTVLYSSVASLILLKLIDLTIGLRVSEEDELMGLDASLHGETIIGGPRKGRSLSDASAERISAM